MRGAGALAGAAPGSATIVTFMSVSSAAAAAAAAAATAACAASALAASLPFLASSFRHFLASSFCISRA